MLIKKDLDVSSDTNYANRIEKIQQQDDIDAKFGYERVNDTVKRTAWLVNFQAVHFLFSLYLFNYTLIDLVWDRRLVDKEDRCRCGLLFSTTEWEAF